ncbi:MAG: hypothetical protein K6T74_12725 [Geminicoccaceae bacterium]|nr:hypothetical protein [Geminicoccaceae bacterium]
MAERPVFLPPAAAPWRIREVVVTFDWHPGLSRSQKQKSIEALHAAARRDLGVQRPLEISSASPGSLGRAVSAFFLEVEAPDGSLSTVESVFQGSKVFGPGEGPFTDLYGRPGREARSDPRLVDPATGERKKPVAFRYGADDWPVESQTAFYDWLYVRALLRRSDLADQLAGYDAFTDIAFNPARSLNCQARAAAVFLASLRRLGGREALEAVVRDPARFRAEHRALVSGEAPASEPLPTAEPPRQGSLFEESANEQTSVVNPRGRGRRAGGASRRPRP